RLTRVTRKLVVDHRRMEENFQSTQGYVIAEPLYILLAAYGHPDAHEAVRQLTLKFEQSEGTLYDLATADPKLRPYLDRFTPEQVRVLQDPSKYLGISARKARSVCDKWEARMAALKLR